MLRRDKGLAVDRGDHAGPRHRREHGALQRDRCADAATFAVSNPTSSAPDDGRPRSTTPPGFSFSYPLYEDFRTKADAFSGFLAVGNVNPMRLGMAGDGSRRCDRSRANPRSLGQLLLGPQPRAVAGRVLVPADDDLDVTCRCCRAQRRFLGATLRARPAYRRPPNHDQRRSIHDCRRRARRVSRSGGRRRSGHLVAQSFHATPAEWATRLLTEPRKLELACHRPAGSGADEARARHRRTRSFRPI